nr:hypothetical protein [uncultured Cohaesibacter sp.]
MAQDRHQTAHLFTPLYAIATGVICSENLDYTPPMERTTPNSATR